MSTVIVLLFLAQVLAVVGLARSLHRPTLRWSVAPVVAASLGADVTMAYVTDDSFRPLGGALSLGLIAVLLGQVVRVDRTEVIEALVAGCGALLATAPAALVIGLVGLPQGVRPAVAIAAAAVIGALPLPPTPGPAGVAADVGRVVVGTVAAVLICTHSSAVEPFDGFLLGLPAGAVSMTGRLALTPPYAKIALLAPVLMGITAGAVIGRGILG